MTERRKEEIFWSIFNETCLEATEEEKAREIFNGWLTIGYDDEGPTDYGELAYCMEKEAHPEWYE